MADGARLGPEARRTAALRERPRHRPIIRSAHDGARLSRINRLAYFFGVPPGHGILTTTGCRTGRSRAKTLRVVTRGATAYVVMLRPPDVAIANPDACSGWVRNLRRDPNVRLKLGRTTFHGRARELTRPDELESARALLSQTVHLVDYVEYALHRRGWPTRARVQDLHRYWFDTGIPIALDLS